MKITNSNLIQEGNLTKKAIKVDVKAKAKQEAYLTLNYSWVNNILKNKLIR